MIAWATAVIREGPSIRTHTQTLFLLLAGYKQTPSLTKMRFLNRSISALMRHVPLNRATKRKRSKLRMAILLVDVDEYFFYVSMTILSDNSMKHTRRAQTRAEQAF